MTTHLILAEAIMLKVYGDDPYNKHARTELVRHAEKASINMNEVMEIRFAGINITRDGMVPIITEKATVPAPTSTRSKSKSHKQKLQPTVPATNESENIDKKIGNKLKKKPVKNSSKLNQENKQINNNQLNTRYEE